MTLRQAGFYKFLLSGEEFKVLMELAEHGPLTETELVKGTRRDGRRVSYGTGLSLARVRPALAALLTFRFVARAGESYSAATFANIDVAALKQRAKAALLANRGGEEPEEEDTPAPANDDEARNAILLTLTRHFCEACAAKGITVKPPKREGLDGTAEIKLQDKWDDPLWEIYTEVSGEEQDEAEGFITEAIGMALRKQTVIASPKSILTYCRNLAGSGNSNGNGNGNGSNGSGPTGPAANEHQADYL